MHDIVQDRDAEDAEKRGVRLVARERELVEVGRHAWYETEHADEQEHCTHCEAGPLDRVPSRGHIRCGGTIRCTHRGAFPLAVVERAPNPRGDGWQTN